MSFFLVAFPIHGLRDTFILLLLLLLRIFILVKLHGTRSSASNGNGGDSRCKPLPFRLVKLSGASKKERKVHLAATTAAM